jgi:hypothetical protein
MTQDEVIDMAKQAGMVVVNDEFSLLPFLEAFAKLVAAKEREACAKMFDGAVWAYDYREIASAIRARGEQA